MRLIPVPYSLEPYSPKCLEEGAFSEDGMPRTQITCVPDVRGPDGEGAAGSLGAAHFYRGSGLARDSLACQRLNPSRCHPFGREATLLEQLSPVI